MAYALVAIVLLGVALVALGLLVLSSMAGDVLLGLFGLILGVVAGLLGYRMLVAAVEGRRLYWWPGQRDYDQRTSR